MEPESSLPHSQVSATCPYPEPVPAAPSGPWSPHYRGFTITFLWTNDQPDAETSI
jgi:hypothetical protein